jgi:Domain of unknown function (DUF397)
MDWRKSSYSFQHNCVEAASWRTSSYSFANHNCVEAASWRTPSRSMSNGHCVSVGLGESMVGVRDSRLGDVSPVLEFGGEAWRRFLAALKPDHRTLRS